MSSPVQDKSSPLRVSREALAALSVVEKAIAAVMIDAGLIVVAPEESG